MDYEKAYKEAISRADKHYARHIVEDIFPELKESEDERIRKEIIAVFKGKISYTSEEDAKKYIAWLEKQGDANKEYWRGYREGKKEILDKYSELEKQGEQKTEENKGNLGGISSNWSDEDEMFLFNITKDLEKLEKESKIEQLKDVYSKEISWFKSIKDRVQPQPKQEWSEKDKANLDNIIWLCENCENGIENIWIPSQAREIKELIKSLKPHWKPTEEQMRVLQTAIRDYGVSHEKSIFESLYNDLKNL